MYLLQQYRAILESWDALVQVFSHALPAPFSRRWLVPVMAQFQTAVPDCQRYYDIPKDHPCRYISLIFAVLKLPRLRLAPGRPSLPPQFPALTLTLNFRSRTPHSR